MYLQRNAIIIIAIAFTLAYLVGFGSWVWSFRT